MEMSQDLLLAPEVDVTAQKRPAREEQVTQPTAMATDEELLKQGEHSLRRQHSHPHMGPEPHAQQGCSSQG
ncbi:uncharacterized protein ACA1_231150 [Acanthamoeba castellanii str. Neff]|uniref:Uncharacterized protein n=1 Tax=Acanthamoeba castellanii (strain ATCC 30010 / Neff) TaxID=1257118 RepID=L8HAE4_ACACF|nr:uncharacterized protein ACA1_231150 [Acanthamoeba castellanii str. Neff]ELR21678.1 hypothetical protein ACA1_231150 [Acanthamoeba castellanii str. Neff]